MHFLWLVEALQGIGAAAVHPTHVFRVLHEHYSEQGSCNMLTGSLIAGTSWALTK